jgi:hypothetical protein
MPKESTLCKPGMTLMAAGGCNYRLAATTGWLQLPAGCNYRLAATTGWLQLTAGCS